MKLLKALQVMTVVMVTLLVGCQKEEIIGTRPAVTSTNPTSSATGIPINRKISATFSVAMDPTTMTTSKFTLMQGATVVAGTVDYTGTTATFMPTANLTPNTVYTATITTGAKTTVGTGMIKDYVWSFTTGATPDTTSPAVASVNPANSTTGITINHTIVANFTEPLDPFTINSTTFTVKQGSTPVSGTVIYTGSTATFTPAANLANNTVYTVTITGAKDMAGNLLPAYSYSFTTVAAADITLPAVNGISPLNNATNVARNRSIALTFSEAMDPLTINNSTFTLTQGATPVTGTVAYSGTTATFTPTVILAAGLVYTATITTGAKDLAGNALAAATVWSFTTGSATSGQAVVDLGAAGNYVILAKTTITNIPGSAITGDLGLSPAATSFFTGFALTNATGYATSTQVTGKMYAADMAAPTPINLTTAVNNMLTAYTDAAGRPTPDFFELSTGNIGGKTLTPGLYKWTNTVTVPSNVTISGGPNDVWIFQIAGDLTVSSAVNVTLNGGAQAKNIFWQVAGQATLGTTSHFEGIILSQTGITYQTGASMNGRALAQTAVILDSNAITKPN